MQKDKIKIVMITVASRRVARLVSRSERVLDSLYFRQRRPKTKLQKWAVQEGRHTTKSTCNTGPKRASKASEEKKRKGKTRKEMNDATQGANATMLVL